MAGAFAPQGPTYVIGGTAVQCRSVGGTSYRVRNLQNTQQYLTWGSSDQVTAAGPPTTDVPSEDTIGMDGNRTEVFSLPTNAWFVSDRVGDTFEVTPGEGGE